MPSDLSINQESLSILACPITKGSLEVRGESFLQSEDGDNCYSVKEGVANFLKSQEWDSPNNDQLQRLLEVAGENGCQVAIEEVFGDYAYVNDHSRAIYLDLLPITENSQVLEIGASLGQHSRLIASRCKHLEALEVVPEQALFAKRFCDSVDGANVNVCVGGDRCLLPYKDSVFDIVIMNYVLEWSAGRTELHPQDAHELLIAECNRVLRPGGVLFLSTKNRYNLRLLKGGFDEHVEFRFGNALPRWLMRFIYRFRESDHGSGYLHSFNALQNILRQCGFGTNKPLLALPDARYPQAYSKFTNEGLSNLRSNMPLLSSNRLTKFLLKFVPNWAIPYVAPSLVFIAKKKE